MSSKKRTNGYITAILIQEVIVKLIMDPSTKRSVVAQLARAWDVLEDRKRILRGKPLPGMYRPENPVRKVKTLELASAKAFLEAIPADLQPDAMRLIADNGKEPATSPGETPDKMFHVEQKESLCPEDRPHTPPPGPPNTDRGLIGEVSSDTCRGSGSNSDSDGVWELNSEVGSGCEEGSGEWEEEGAEE